MLQNIIFIIIGFVLLVFGADWLVKGSSQVAKRFHIPEILIGLTIVAIGTSMPEVFITITSATRGNTDLIIGNAIGSNLCNLLLILGIISIIHPIKFDEETRNFHLLISLLSTFLIIFLGNTIGAINRTYGTVLLVLFGVYIFHPIFMEIRDILKTREEDKKQNKKQEINVFISIVYIILGIVLLKFGGDFVVDHAEEIAKTFNVSDRIIGLTIVAIGTALPEMVTSIIAAFKKSLDMAVGNLVGSTVLNLLLILGLGGVITPLHYSPEFNINLILLASVIILIWLFNFMGKKYTLTRANGSILFSIFVIYIFRLIVI